MRVNCFLAMVVCWCLIFEYGWGYTYFSSADGDWSDATKWTSSDGGSSFPGVGDVCTVNHAMTVQSDQAVGTSPPDETTMAVTVNSNGSVVLAPNVTMTLKGNLFNNAGSSATDTRFGLRLNEGSRLVFDVTASTYVLKVGRYAKLYARGLAGNRAVFTCTSSASGNRVRMTKQYYKQGGCFDFDQVDFKRFGSRTVAAISDGIFAGSGGCPEISISTTTFDGNGALAFGVNSAGSRISIADSRFLNSVSNLESSGSAVMLTGVNGNGDGQLLTRNYFQSEVSFSPPASWLVTENIFHKNLNTFPSNLAGTLSPLESFGLFAHNYIEINLLRNIEGPITDNYFIQDNDAAGGTLLSTHASSGERSIDGNIFDYTGTGNGGDWIVPTSDNGFTLRIERNINLPNRMYTTGGAFVSTWTIPVNQASKIAINGNTFVTSGDSDETGVAVGHSYSGYDQYRNGVAGEITSFRNNLVWTPPGSIPGWKLIRQASLMSDFLLAVDADYNWGWNLAKGSEGKGYDAWPSYRSTPIFAAAPELLEQHSAALNGDPLFVDWTRNMPSFDRDGLGNGADSWWAAGVVYDCSDSSPVIVSSSDAGNYRDKAFNYHCIASHTAGADSKPGAGALWRQYWEYATVYRLRNDMALIPRLISWVKDGFVPLHPALATAGEGGTFIGAQQLSRPTLDVTIGGSGGGSVNSVPSGPIACTYPKQQGACSTMRIPGAMLTLAAVPDADSLFTGWGGDCASCAATTCDVPGNLPLKCTAQFSFVEPVRISGAQPEYLATLNSAYHRAATGDLVESRSYAFKEELACDQPKNITIRGGYDSAYVDRDGYTLLFGSLTVSGGAVTVDRLVIQ